MRVEKLSFWGFLRFRGGGDFENVTILRGGRREEGGGEGWGEEGGGEGGRGGREGKGGRGRRREGEGRRRERRSSNG
jgi:hypothetical protein